MSNLLTTMFLPKKYVVLLLIVGVLGKVVVSTALRENEPSLVNLETKQVYDQIFNNVITIIIIIIPCMSSFNYLH